MSEIIKIETLYMRAKEAAIRRGDVIRALYYEVMLARMNGSRTWDQSRYVLALRPSEFFPGPWKSVVLYPNTYSVIASNGRRVAYFLDRGQATKLVGDGS